MGAFNDAVRELEQERLLHQETRGAVAAWKQLARTLRDALEGVAHHADDECGFMDVVRVALKEVEAVDFGETWVDAGYTNTHGSTVMRRVAASDEAALVRLRSEIEQVVAEMRAVDLMCWPEITHCADRLAALAR